MYTGPTNSNKLQNTLKIITVINAGRKLPKASLRGLTGFFSPSLRDAIIPSEQNFHEALAHERLIVPLHAFLVPLPDTPVQLSVNPKSSFLTPRQLPKELEAADRRQSRCHGFNSKLSNIKKHLPANTNTASRLKSSTLACIIFIQRPVICS